LRFRLHLDLPGPPEKVDVIDEISAQRGLQRLKHAVERNAENLRLVAVDIEVDRWVRCRVGAEHTRQLRILIGGDGEPAHGLRERLRIAAAQIFQHVGEAAARTKADDRWWC